jgi:RsiW-degrading membrane proteinase PrsW (M82 family)
MARTNPVNQTIKRELQVAFSRKAQPLWLRLVKWIVIVVLVVRFRSASWFWTVAAIVFLAAIALHLFYRHMTHRWTRVWGGWNDVSSVDPL